MARRAPRSLRWALATGLLVGVSRGSAPTPRCAAVLILCTLRRPERLADAARLSLAGVLGLVLALAYAHTVTTSLGAADAMVDKAAPAGLRVRSHT